MDGRHLRVVEARPLRSIISLPDRDRSGEGLPVLCFLHGYGEAAPMDIRKALTLHGPLRRGGAPQSAKGFITIAPQLPLAGDIWRHYAGHVVEIVEKVRAMYEGDPARTYLTGFSFGGNGVFDVALSRPGFWAALWPVDPTRVPETDPGGPIWLSFGEVSRRYKNGFIEALGLEPASRGMKGDRVYLDQGEDHVGSAALAYRDHRIYEWLLMKKRIC